MDILVIGTGYVGLVTGACFSEMGHKVTCLDIDKEKIEKLKKGIIPIYEPGLEEVVKRNVRENRLSFTTDYKEGIQGAEICFIAVPTPSGDDGSCDLSYVKIAAQEIAKYIENYKVIVNKSTVPVGTGYKVKEIIKGFIEKEGKNIDFDIVSNPEFLKEGTAVSDCLKPDRIVIGVDNEKSEKIMRDLYDSFTINYDKILVMDVLSSEMTKYAANAMLATRISFMNEISQICQRVGADVNKVRIGIGSDSRIGYSFLYAGIGYGGSCFPKDVRALYQTAKKHGYNANILEAVEGVNFDQKFELGKKITSYFTNIGGLLGKTIGVWGLSFKPDTDDMREAPSVILINELLEKGAIVKVYDPVAMDNAKKILANKNNIIWCQNEFEAAKDVDAIALLTEWKQFRRIDMEIISKIMKGQVLFDGRNQYHPKEINKKGLDYIGIGLPPHYVKK